MLRLIITLESARKNWENRKGRKPVIRALAYRPEYAEAHNNLAALLQASNRDAEARNSYKRALALKPDFVEAHFGLGQVYAKLKDLQGAALCFEKTLELEPEDTFGASLELVLLGRRKTPQRTPDRYMEESLPKKVQNLQ